MRYTVQLGSVGALKLMIAHGAPVIIETDDGFPLLHLAIDRADDPAIGMCMATCRYKYHPAFDVDVLHGYDVPEGSARA